MKETREMQVQSLGQEDSLKEEMATHFSILAWRIPWTEGPGGLQSIKPQRVTRLSMHACTTLQNIVFPKSLICRWKGSF